MKDNKIERLIDNIKDYVDSCKFKAFSNTDIIVNKDQMDQLLNELKSKIPRELEQSRQILQNRQDILEDARNKAQELINKTTEKTSALVNEHQIMLEAYRMADEVVDKAMTQAQGIIDSATMEANELKSSAMDYTDNILAQVEQLVHYYLEQSNARYNNLYSSLEECLSIVQNNRAELAPPEAPIEEQVELLLNDDMDTGTIDIIENIE